MLRNYLKIAFRTLKRSKGYAFINVFGLALGIACCVLLFLFVRHELSYDRFHEKADRIYRVVQVTTAPSGEKSLTGGGPAPLAPALAASFPGVEEAVRLAGGSVSVQHQGTPFEARALFADSSFFEVFTFPLQKGNPQTVLAGANTVVLTERAAQTYFGSGNPLGQTLTVKFESETLDLRVAGVLENPPPNSSLQFDLLLPFSIQEYMYPESFQLIIDSWDFPSRAGTFVLLHEAAQAEALEGKLTDLFERKTESGEEEVITIGENEFARLQLQPLTEIHLSPEVDPEALVPPGNPLYAYLLSGVALLVLLIACINFMTLALGRSASRAKEVGVRKVVGAHRGQIRRQFWGEALLTSGAALVVGLFLARGFLPVFNELAGKELQLNLFGRPETLLFLIGLALVAGLSAGSYPALVLSRFEPARILRGNAVLGGGHRLTRALVVVQFTLSIGLVVGTLVMSAQLRFVQTDLGFNQEQVVCIEGAEEDIFESFRQEALRHAGVKNVAGVTFSFFGAEFEYPLALGDTGRVEAHILPVSDTFLETLRIEVIEGRGFSAERASGGALVNHAFVRAMGWRSALGKVLPAGAGRASLRAIDSARVVGVVANFHMQSMHQQIEPVVFLPSADFGGVDDIYVRIAPEGIAQTLASLRETWQEVAPDRPFQYQFLDEVVAEAYENERRWRAIIRYAAGFALVIACFGLFGLAALAAERRTKEIGIRKVLGASVPSVVMLLSKDFLQLIGIAFVIAAPLAYLGARRWLEDFAYRIDLGPWLFVGAGALVLVIALLTVSYQAIRAALADPVEALRYE